MELKQFQKFSKREFKIKDEILCITSKSFGETKQWSVKLEDLGDTKYYHTISKVAINVIAVFFCTLLAFATVDFFTKGSKSDDIVVLLTLYVVMGGLALILFLIPKKKELHLLGGLAHVMFVQDTPSKQEVEKFVDEIIAKSKKILIKKYGQIDTDLPEETQMNQLNWLRNKSIISQQKYEQLKQEYKVKKMLGGGYFMSNN